MFYSNNYMYVTPMTLISLSVSAELLLPPTWMRRAAALMQSSLSFSPRGSMTARQTCPQRRLDILHPSIAIMTFHRAHIRPAIQSQQILYQVERKTERKRPSHSSCVCGAHCVIAADTKTALWGPQAQWLLYRAPTLDSLHRSRLSPRSNITYPVCQRHRSSTIKWKDYPSIL